MARDAGSNTMTAAHDEHERVEALVPWFANGTLDAAERQRVEAHARRCARCRESIERARAQVELLGRQRGADRLDEVHPRLLVEYAEHPDHLDAETRERIERRLERSAVDREALDHLRKSLEVEQTTDAAAHVRTEHTPDVARPRPRVAPDEGVFVRWARSLLAPAPAFAYLVLLAVAVPVLWLGRADRVVGSPAGVPVHVPITGEASVRDGPRGQAEALRLEPDAAGVVLELETELGARELEGIGASFAIEIRRGDLVVWTAELMPDRFRPQPAGSVVLLTLDPRRFPEGERHEVVIRAVKPDDPIDGQALFRRSFRFERR